MSRLLARESRQQVGNKRIDRRSDGRFDMNLRVSVDETMMANRANEAAMNDASGVTLEKAPSYSRHPSMYGTQLGMTDRGVNDMEQQDWTDKKVSEKPAIDKTLSLSIKPKVSDKPSAFATKVYTVGHLIFFSFFGVLARLGLQALTFYPGAPAVFTVLWANFTGTIVMGYLMEDTQLFREEWGTPTYANAVEYARRSNDEDTTADIAAAKKAHGATKKTIPLYVGLATGFCGSFTSFSSFIRDCFLALSNDLPTPLDHPSDFAANGTALVATTTTVDRNAGFSILAISAVIIITLALCVRALYIGIAAAELFQPYSPSLSFHFTHNFINPFIVFLGIVTWIIVVVLAIFPPHPEWRGIGLFALVFAPLGCLTRFYVSLYLNPWFAKFPFGTFAVNIIGTAILGVAFTVQHSANSSVIGCQVSQGIMDGFCGALTTISTWIVELTTLKKGPAYIYGSMSIGVALAMLIAIMGSVRWTVGFSDIKCVH
ncbi:hypothetical protein BP6252_11016 [Coleophoma cylindrospora]|uniref:Chromosome condensation protein n=1 Tax=Coleophoma cylindrospora TaxID=1849047 RepID=A0A3D8QP19_9HELO|nr:hypothetical protein BP6252_11016 [Coleophoma cylindrospora]